MARRDLQIKERERIFTLTPSAVTKVRELAAQEGGTTDVALRLEVQPGGCAGFRYGLFFDDEIVSTDIVDEFDGVRVVCDPMSAPYLKGVVIDWAESLQKSGFVIENPNAQSSCACGDSFQ